MNESDTMNNDVFYYKRSCNSFKFWLVLTQLTLVVRSSEIWPRVKDIRNWLMAQKSTLNILGELFVNQRREG